MNFKGVFISTKTKKIKVLSTENPNYFTVGEEYDVVDEGDISIEGDKCEVMWIIDDEGDLFAIVNQREATYEIITETEKET